MSLKKNNKDDQAIRSALQSAERIALFSHIHPDGDAIGAQLGLAAVLRAMGKEVAIYNQTGQPGTFAFLPGMADLRFWGEDDFAADLLVALDCGNLERLGLSETEWRADQRVSIDHHMGHELFSDLNYVDAEAPATCAILADFCRNWNFPVSADAATCFLTGLHTDTGSFRFEKTKAETFQTAAWLMEKGADLSAIRYHVFESTSQARFQLLNAMYQSSEFLSDGHIAIAEITYEQMLNLGVNDDEVHGLVGQLKEVQGVELSILLRELSSGAIKVSLRSKQYLDCNRLASEFNGGGHVRAAGCTVHSSLKEARQTLLAAAARHLKEDLPS